MRAFAARHWKAAADIVTILSVVLLFAFGGTLCINHGALLEPHYLEAALYLLDFCLTMVAHMVWRRADPEMPLLWWGVPWLAALAIVPTLRIVLVRHQGHALAFVSSKTTTLQYKHIALAFFACAFVFNLIVPSAVHVWRSRRLARSHAQFLLFGLAILGFGMYCQWADYYTDTYVVQYSGLFLVPWAALLWMHSRAADAVLPALTPGPGPAASNSADCNSAYVSMSAVYLLLIPQALGGLMFRLLILSQYSSGLQVLCVLVYQAAVVFAQAVWHRTVVGQFPSERDHYAFDFIIQWYMVLFAEMVFVQIDPTSAAFPAVLILSRLKDFGVRTGYVTQFLQGDGAALWAGLATQLMWYQRWEVAEIQNLADTMASVAVVFALLAEKVLADRKLGRRVLTLYVMDEDMWRLWVAFAFIIASRFLVMALTSCVHRRRLGALRHSADTAAVGKEQQARLRAGEGAGGGFVTNPMVQATPQAEAEEAPNIGGDVSLASRVAAAGKRGRNYSLFEPGWQASTKVQLLFWRDPIIMFVGIGCCALYTILIVYTDRLYQLTGRLK